MSGLGLSEIEDLQDRLNCRKGLLIDFDYASFLVPETTTTTGRADGSNVNESLGKSQVESESRIQSSRQGSGHSD